MGHVAHVRQHLANFLALMASLAEEEEEPEQQPEGILVQRQVPWDYRDPASGPCNEDSRPLHVPDWGVPLDNALGTLPLSPLHFICVVAVNGVATEAIIDSGGARSIASTQVAQALGLEWEAADQEKVGMFWGPGGKPTPYKGVVRGPIELRFDDRVVIRLPELRVIDHAVPLFLLGADFMAHRAMFGWQFASVGIDGRGGHVTFTRPERRRPRGERGGVERRRIGLITWPASDQLSTTPHGERKRAPRPPGRGPQPRGPRAHPPGPAPVRSSTHRELEQAAEDFEAHQRYLRERSRPRPAPANERASGHRNHGRDAADGSRHLYEIFRRAGGQRL